MKKHVVDGNVDSVCENILAFLAKKDFTVFADIDHRANAGSAGLEIPSARTLIFGDVEASGLWPDPVVTRVTPAATFWEAEPEHRNYLQRVPHGYTCHYPRPDWKLPAKPESNG